MVDATTSNVLDIFKMELIVSHYVNICFWSLGRLIVFPPVCFLFEEFVCEVPSAGLCPRVSLLNTDSVSAGPYTDTLCLISWLAVGIGPLVLGNLFRGNQWVRNSHPVSLFHFVDENTKAQRDRELAHFRPSSQTRAGRTGSQERWWGSG